MNDKRKLREAVRYALGLSAGVLTVAATAPTALAQQAPADQAPKEELIVTGSRIKRADLSSASPITVLKREDILSTGYTDVGQILQTHAGHVRVTDRAPRRIMVVTVA